MSHACMLRNLNYHGLSRQDVDILDDSAIENVIRSHKPDLVVNSVALVGIDPCEKDTEMAHAVHVHAVRKMASVCSELDAVFVQPSTHAVFDGNKDGFYTESDCPLPTNIYGVTKLASEHIARYATRRHYVPRFPTLFGPRRNKALGFVDKMVQRLRNGQTVKVASDKIDSPTYSLDAANIILDMVEGEKPYGVYHVVNSGAVSYFDLIEALRDHLNSSSQIFKAKEADFPGLAPKPLRTAMKSEKLPEFRTWDAALEAWIDEFLE